MFTKTTIITSTSFMFCWHLLVERNVTDWFDWLQPGQQITDKL
ncbi:MAG: hypothetical protein ACR2LM_18420 [Pyrinomonadaceae bacterium]